MENTTARAIDWTEQGLVPDSVIRHGIRRLLKRRLATLTGDDCEANAASKSGFIRMMDMSPLAPLPHLANEQHYEVPADFFTHVLGKSRKYSCCYWDNGVSDLDTAECEALRITCEHAGLQDGMDILELGCGWGSLTLWMARHYPHSHITAVSNSSSQRHHIMKMAASEQLANIRCAHLRHERLRSRNLIRPHCVGRDVRTHAQLSGTVRAHQQLAQAGWPVLHAHLLHPQYALCLRSA